MVIKKSNLLMALTLLLTLMLSSCTYNQAPPQVKTFVNLTGYGNVSGPINSTDEAIVRYDGISGKVVQNSNVTIDDDGNIFIPETRTIDELHQLVDKEYVDAAVSDLGLRFYMLNDSSGISDYKIACPLGCPVDGFDFTYGGLVDGQYITGWISRENITIDTLIAGHYDWNIFLEKTSGTRDLRVYWTMNERLSNGTEILIATSSTSNLITSKFRDRIPLVLDDDYVLSNNGRIVGKIYAVVGTSGLAPTIKIYGGGVDNSHWAVPTRSEFLELNFVPYDGAMDDVDLGTHDLTATDLNAERLNGHRINQFWSNDFTYPSGTYNGNSIWVAGAINSGTMSVISSQVTKDRPGVNYLRSSTTPRSGYYFSTTTAAYVIGGGEKTHAIFRPYSSTSNNIITFGWSDTHSAYLTPQDGIFIKIENLEARAYTTVLGLGEIVMRDIKFSSDGTKIYWTGSNLNSVWQQELNTAWDISTSKVMSYYVDVSAQDSIPQGISFKDDGTKMYMSGSTGDDVYQYTLSTAWDVTTATYDTVLVDNSGRDLTTTGHYIGNSGAELYIIGQTNDKVYQYTLSTPWDLSTATYTRDFSFSAYEATPHAITFKPDGTAMYIMGSTGDDINEFTLSTPWDISSASYTTVKTQTQDTLPTGLFFKSDGTQAWLMGDTNNVLYQYTLGTAWDISTLTYESITTYPSVYGTRSNTSYTLDTLKYYNFYITINDDATSVHYEIYDSPPGALPLWEETINTTIPTGLTGHGISTVDWDTVASYEIFLDYIDLEIDRVFNR